ncbi:universal stress protein [Nocardioides sp. zg-1228]|uniref:universal stress protein n=1 Tax=Nocardioides sp. zg-1228 TaxID=2763008 RepID=UPI0016430945|nr:universal stress protein [Nocardioides sp. zg-1228]MBC2935165.1 universal stress protein [Nocardioides sp. zg-1228]QSF56099.1 universal stress protein [Nocardioides sp. zg-1228]
MDDTTRSILVAYDGSTDADLALGWAVRDAQLQRRPVTVAIVEETGATPGVAWQPADHWIEVERRATAILAEAPVDAATVVRTHGPAVTTLVDLSRDAALLVVGGRGHGLAGELFVGSVSQHLATHAACPVVVVRVADAPDARRIVVGVDGSAASDAALDVACRHARVTGETVSAVRAAAVGTVHVDRHGEMPDALGRLLNDEGERLAATVEAAAARHPEVDIESDLIALAPAAALIEASKHASLVVVGSRGLNPFAGLLLGSVSHAVLHRARCPVMVVR